MTLPGMSGEETLRELQKISSDVAVVLSCGFGEAEALRRFGRLQVAGFLQKPYSMKKLAECVHDAAASVASRS
jgi:two-component system, cell cycle sensor histidine kinase and response regulator CckA